MGADGESSSICIPCSWEVSKLGVLWVTVRLINQEILLPGHFMAWNWCTGILKAPICPRKAGAEVTSRLF